MPRPDPGTMDLVRLSARPVLKAMLLSALLGLVACTLLSWAFGDPMLGIVAFPFLYGLMTAGILVDTWRWFRAIRKEGKEEAE